MKDYPNVGRQQFMKPNNIKLNSLVANSDIKVDFNEYDKLPLNEKNKSTNIHIEI